MLVMATGGDRDGVFEGEEMDEWMWCDPEGRRKKKKKSPRPNPPSSQKKSNPLCPGKEPGKKNQSTHLIPPLHAHKLLHQPHGRIARLRQRKLLTDADARPAVEGQVLPARTQGLPALGSEGVGVGAVVVGPAVHAVEGPGEDVAAGEEEGGLAVRAAAEGEDGVGEGFAGVAGDDGVEAVGVC